MRSVVRWRSLARAAYRVLPCRGGHAPAFTPDAIARVLEQVDQLRHRLERLQQLHALQLEELVRWASNLRFTAFGAEAGEVMAVVQVTMLAGLPYPTLRDAVLTHPTMAEGLAALFSSVPRG